MSGASRSGPFFIVGAQRSGTTMLRLMLNSHPNIAIPFETGFMTDFYPRLGGYGDLAQRSNLERLLGDIGEYHKVKQGKLIEDRDAVLGRPIAGYADLIDAVMSAYAARKGKPRWGDKTPFYVTELDTLWRIFPGCRILHLVRDGRDVAISQRSVGWASTSIPRLAEDWRWKTVLAHKVGMVLGDHYREVRYEDLVLDTEATLRTICDFIGEPYDAAMLDYHAEAAGEMPEQSMKWHKSSVKAPDADKVFAWKRQMTVADRILYQDIAADALEIFGYEREDLPRTMGSRLKGVYYCLMKRW